MTKLFRKKCNKCFQTKTHSEFYKNKETKDGYYGACKECRKKWQQDYQKENNERIVAVHRSYREQQAVGIYAITNTNNNTIYVGQSTMIKQRWLDHQCRLNRGDHENNALQKDWDEHKAEVFRWEVLEEYPKNTSRATLLENEAKFINQFSNDGKLLYNTTTIKEY